VNRNDRLIAPDNVPDFAGEVVKRVAMLSEDDEFAALSLSINKFP